MKRYCGLPDSGLQTRNVGYGVLARGGFKTKIPFTHNRIQHGASAGMSREYLLGGLKPRFRRNLDDQGLINVGLAGKARALLHLLDRKDALSGG